MQTLKQENASQTKNMLKVLIVDDDTPTRMLLRAAISQWGYEIIEAKDGEEAWNILQQTNPPKLLIFDWLMPKLDGIALCKQSRQQLNYHPYIILLTQASGPVNLIKALDAGADEFLSKPFNMAELRSRLSIGSRIVNYVNDLAEMNNLQNNYLLNIESLTTSLLELSEEAMKILNDDIKNINEDKLKQARNYVTTINQLAKKFQDDYKKNGKK